MINRFIFPRLISIFRLALNASSAAAAGPLPYQEAHATAGVVVWNSSPIFTGIACSIQEETRGKMSTVGLPGSDIVPNYRVFIPLEVMPLGSVKVHDYVLDDIGLKYRVADPYWDSLGYRLLCVFLEV